MNFVAGYLIYVREHEIFLNDTVSQLNHEVYYTCAHKEHKTLNKLSSFNIVRYVG